MSSLKYGMAVAIRDVLGVAFGTISRIKTIVDADGEHTEYIVEIESATNGAIVQYQTANEDDLVELPGRYGSLERFVETSMGYRQALRQSETIECRREEKEEAERQAKIAPSESERAPAEPAMATVEVDNDKPL